MTINIQNLTKTYARKSKALDSISLDIPQGIFGLVGPCDAGKSTLIHILAGISTSDGGTVAYDGELSNKGKVPCTVGFVQQNTCLLPHLTLSEFLDYICVLKGMNDKKKRADEANRCLALTNLESKKEARLSSFTSGLLAHASLAQALLGDPALILLDEPIAKLDCAEKYAYYDLLTKATEGKTVIISSENILDIVPVSSSFCILQKGQVAYSGSLSDFVVRIDGATWEQKATPKEKDEIWKTTIVTAAIKQGEQTVIRYIDVNKIYESSVSVKPTVEDAYIYTCGGINQ